MRCPRCGSPDPKKHPAVQFEGEVQVCPHPWHTPQPDTERDEARGRDAERELEVFVMLARFVDQHHWYDTDYCHPVPGEDCSPWCSACEVLRHVDDQVLREAREANGYARD